MSGASPFLGSLFGPIAAAAGTALGIAGQLINRHEENELEFPTIYKAHASRAILAEASLQTLLQMNDDLLRKYRIPQNVFKTSQANKADVEIIAKKLAPALMDSAVQIPIAEANQPVGTVTSSLASYPRILVPRATESAMDSKADAFARSLQQAARNENHEEAFVEFIGSVAQVGIEVNPIAIGAISHSLAKAESFSEPEPNQDSVDEHVKTLFDRSIMGEAALQALLTIPPEDMHAAGFLGNFVEVIKNIGSTVINVTPNVVETVTPLVVGEATGESDFGDGKPNPQGGKQLRKSKKSIADLLDEIPPSPLLESTDDSNVRQSNTEM